MSLEEALNANTKAVLAHNALLEKIATGGKSGAAPAAGKPAAPAAVKPAAPAEKPKPKPATRKAAETTVEHVTEKVKEYLKGGDDSERVERKENVKKIIDYYGVDRFTNIDPAQFDDALAFLAQFEDGVDPWAEDDQGNDEGDGDDDGVV